MKKSHQIISASVRRWFLTGSAITCTAGLFAAEPERIDLPTVLRLAGAQNLDIKFAAEKLNEARANEKAALWQFFPWVAPGVGYKAHDGRIQDVQGNIIDTNKQSYAIGPSVIAQVDFGDAIYKRLAAKQLTIAAGHGVEAQRLQSVLDATEAYFDLSKAHASAQVNAESVQVSREIRDEITKGVEVGVAFKGDQLRAETQLRHSELSQKQAEEQRSVAAVKLAQVLHLDRAVSLLPREDDVVPLNLSAADALFEKLLADALAKRPELKQDAALADAAQTAVRGAKYGPMVPTLGAQVYTGGLGGGRNGDAGHFGASEDYKVTLSWRIGPGGLFDSSRIHQAQSKAAQSEIGLVKTRDEVRRQVAENYERVKLLRSELTVAKQGVSAAQEALKLARERKEFAVGVVLETLQSEQDLTRAKLDYVNTIMEFNKAQYRLKAATGK